MSAPAPEPAPVPSVLPEEGLNLIEELERYRMWMIDQALLRTGGNACAAGRLLGYAQGNAVALLLRERRRGVKPQGTKRKASPSTAAPAHDAGPAPERVSITRVASQIDWALVERLRAEGRHDSQICQVLGRQLGMNRFIVEKALHLGEARS